MDVQDGDIPLAPLRGAKGEILNHDCRDGGKIAMIFPSLPLWIPACAGMTLEIPRCAKGGGSSLCSE